MKRIFNKADFFVFSTKQIFDWPDFRRKKNRWLVEGWYRVMRPAHGGGDSDFHRVLQTDSIGFFYSFHYLSTIFCIKRSVRRPIVTSCGLQFQLREQFCWPSDHTSLFAPVKKWQKDFSGRNLRLVKTSLYILSRDPEIHYAFYPEKTQRKLVRGVLRAIKPIRLRNSGAISYGP